MVIPCFIIGITMKERDTKILPVRIKKDLLEKLNLKVAGNGQSRNSWLISLIEKGLEK